MKRSIFYLLFLLVLSIRVNADVKTEKIKKLMDIQGHPILQEAIGASKKQNEKIATNAMNQLISRLNPSYEFKMKFDDAYNSYISRINAPWSATEIMDTWTRFYGPDISEGEINQLITSFSPKFVRTDTSDARRAIPEFQGYYKKAAEPVFEKFTKEFIDELQLIAHECKCEKKSDQPIETTH